MKIAVINGSPKAGESASRKFCEELVAQTGAQADCLRLDWTKYDPQRLQVEELAGCAALVLVFPLYVDGIPSHLLRLLCDLEPELAARAGGPKVYGFVNCGFYEGDQARLALQMLRHWSVRAGLDWGWGLGLGSGPMQAGLSLPPGQGPRKNLGRAYRELTAAMLAGESGEDRFYQPNFPRCLYIMAGN